MLHPCFTDFYKDKFWLVVESAPIISHTIGSVLTCASGWQSISLSRFCSRLMMSILFMMGLSRTTSEPPVYYMPASPTEELQKVLENQEKDFLEWKTRRREELTKYQKDVTEWHLINVETEIERWINRRNLTKLGQEAIGRKEDATEGSNHRPEPQQEEDEQAEEDFNGDEDIVGTILNGEDGKDQEEGEKALKGIVEYASGDDEATVR